MVIILDEYGSIDWNANGWPQPNPEADPNCDGYSIEGMPDTIFEEWSMLCDELDCDI